MVNKNNKGLGRGIDAIFQEFENPDTTTLSQVEDLPLEDIRPNPYQPRKTFDPEALQELADSIKKTGVFQPIIVRKSVNGFEIITGERRYRASKLAGLTTIPAIVRVFDDPSMMEIAVLENLQREDLTPLEEAHAYDNLMKKLGLTQIEVAERLGKSRPYIANYLRLLTLPKDAKDLLADGSLAMAQARALLSLKDKTQIVALAKKAVKEGLTVRQMMAMIKELNSATPKKKAKKPAKSPYLRASENQLGSRFGTKVNIAQTKQGSVKIEIGFGNGDDLNRLLALLDVDLD